MFTIHVFIKVEKHRNFMRLYKGLGIGKMWDVRFQMLSKFQK